MLLKDVPIEFLRNLDAVNDVIDVAVIAVDVNDAVGSASGTRQLQQQRRQTAARRRPRELLAAQVEIGTRTRDGRSRGDRGASDHLEARKGNGDRRARRRDVDAQRRRPGRIADVNVIRAGRHAVERKFAVCVCFRAQSEIASGRGDIHPGHGPTVC